ncbi:MAG: hypothetical protein OEV49_03460 [candidate division Zixibacteria bacterium]|nr:hypothetical protein [candidate division Zixibacteria bacterium]MDH3939268.1 hypothetical protein [candidate division Zixibacteria bacterium]MDH4034690.1 hypothetical protein [candidate division Zixibacteria bacterium]
MSKPRQCLLGFVVAIALLLPISASADEQPIKIFGYFQTKLGHINIPPGHNENSFLVQQLNLILSKDIGDRWRTHVNFEFLNTYSSARNWGDMNLEEAWLRYKPNDRLSFRFGLQIPIFNNLNAIKTKMPLLPYILRPFPYESSFSEIINIEAMAPQRAFVQVDGYLPLGPDKLEFAAYLGNSPDIDSAGGREHFVRGADTTNSFLVGGRVGLNVREDVKIGVSITRDQTNMLAPLADPLGEDVSRFESALRLRLGGDLSFQWRDIYWESEAIYVTVEEDKEDFDLDMTYLYGTLGYHFSEQLFVYGNLQYTDGNEGNARREIDDSVSPADTTIVTFRTNAESTFLVAGATYSINDRIVLKLQYGKYDGTVTPKYVSELDELRFFAAAVSVMF